MYSAGSLCRAAREMKAREKKQNFHRLIALANERHLRKGTVETWRVGGRGKSTMVKKSVMASVGAF